MVTFVRVASSQEIPLGARRRVDVDGYDVTILHVDGGWTAIGYRCPHDGGPLGDGSVANGRITCPLHRWTFDLRDGRAVTDHRVSARIFPVRVEGGEVLVGI
ncbi:MAG TPA: Rieske 2Fe-2S domain-containing protein [Planctomycetota bacterium]|jgi:nitrite reductase/ring-hydroxylating ferredoxin subunit|nr:Rieske 2Fe-2S domain-containing protein [Planctomycetota bacterium]